ncbi:MAG TPA: winged helix-turn-helix domain-containing protein [Vicinamibacterales bacterium]|nr:winged helix-turn-helix domain-containing protein [Vicinamibacterales bacterium]
MGPVRFGVFELDLNSGELRRSGVRIRLHDRSFQVLTALLERPGELVTRQDLQQRLWPADTFVEFDNNLNNAVSRLRDALGDTADNPRFVETVPRRGYRFIAPVEKPAEKAVERPVERPAARSAEAAQAAAPWKWIALVAAAVAALAAWPALRPPPDPVSPAQKIVAVLPFVAGDATEGSADSYIAFGMTEALITELSHVGALKVISQTSVLQYKDARKPLKQIAGELGAGSIVEGSVLREGDQVRITVQLIDAGSDTHLWAQSYGRAPAAALANQRELAREVAGIIRSRIAPSDHTRLPAIEQTNGAAYEAYVKGRYFLQPPSEASWLKAREYFEQSIAADPNFAPAHVGLSKYYGMTDMIPPDEASAKARASALRALALDENLAAAHAALAYVHYSWEWNWVETERRFTRAIELDPNDSWSRRWRASYLSAFGRSATAIEEITRAIELDPVNVAMHDAAGAVFFDARQFDKIIEHAQRINELSPNDPRAMAHLTTAYFHLGDMRRALEYAQRGVDASGRNVAFLCLLAGAQHRAGLTTAAEQTLAEVMQLAAKGYVPDTFLGLTHLWMRGPEAALPFFQRAYEKRDGYLVVMNSSPWFDPIRGHPGYQDLVRRLNFPAR